MTADPCDWCATEACTSGHDVCPDAIRESDDALRGESAGDAQIEQED